MLQRVILTVCALGIIVCLIAENWTSGHVASSFDGTAITLLVVGVLAWFFFDPDDNDG